MKECSKCKEVKTLDNFYKHKLTINGLCYACKPCMIESNKIWRKNNAERRREIARIGYYRRRDKYIKYSKIYRKNNLKACRKKSAEYGQSNRDNLSDTYIKQILCKKNSLAHVDIPKELVEAKKLEMQIRRTLKGETNGKNK